MKDEELLEHYSEIAIAISELADKINKNLPGSREKSLIITKLDEARLWACEAASSVTTTTEPQGEKN